MKRRHFGQRGFTLIEIMVALLIMAGLSLIMAQSVKTGLDSRKKVQLQLTEESMIRDSMRLIVSDVESAFHHRDVTIATYNKVLELRKKKSAQGAQPGTVNPGGTTQANGQPQGAQPGTVSSGAPPTTATPDPLAAATPIPTPATLTGFVGNSEAMTFSVTNHVRRFLDAKESDQARVSYFLRNCRSEGARPGTMTTSSCLMRLEITNPTDEFPLSPSDEDDAKAVALLHNVTEFKLRYIAAEMTDFVDAWDSSPKRDSQTKDKFPDAVEITLAIHDTNNPQSKPRLLSWLAPVRNSNNQTQAEKDAETKSAGGQTGTTGADLGAGTTGTGTQQQKVQQ